MTLVAALDVPESLELLYRHDGGRLWRALLAFSHDPDVASDAVSEAFVQALRRGGRIHRPQAWVWRAAFRLAAAEMQRRRRHVNQPPPDGSYLDAGLDLALLDALQRLPAGQRSALILFYLVDLPVREIAARTGRSSLSIRADLSRGRRRLRSILGDDDG
jgi:RNA polymerase sigma-70 factor, ECF subfamily